MAQDTKTDRTIGDVDGEIMLHNLTPNYQNGEERTADPGSRVKDTQPHICYSRTKGNA